MERVFGFEILPAPFVIAHMQLGLLLQNMHLPLGENERVAVFLTNALTGWEKPHKHEQLSALPELEAERDAAEHVKQELPILVILGNPPYNGYAGMPAAEERGLTDAYRTTKKAPPPQGQGLNDLYVRFFRMAERRIVEKTGKGIVCFISNYSWLDGLSFTGMRERYLEVFDKIWIDNLHGDRIISEYAPDGQTSETVFAMGSRSPGIKVGTSVSLLCARGDRADNPQSVLLYRDFDQAGASERRSALLQSASATGLNDYACLEPALGLGLPFKPRVLADDYLTWPTLPELFPVSFPGVKTSRDEFVVDIDRDRLEQRLKTYFDPDISDEEMRRIAPVAMTSTARFDAGKTRSVLLRRGFLPDNVVRYCYRPSTCGGCTGNRRPSSWTRSGLTTSPRCSRGTPVSSRSRSHGENGRPLRFIRSLGCLDLMDRGATCVPMRTRPVGPGNLFTPSVSREGWNSSDAAERYLTSVSRGDSADLMYLSLAICHPLRMPPRTREHSAKTGPASRSPTPKTCSSPRLTLAARWPIFSIPRPMSLESPLGSSARR